MKIIRINQSKKTIDVYNGSDILMESHSYEHEIFIDTIIENITKVVPKSRHR